MARFSYNHTVTNGISSLNETSGSFPKYVGRIRQLAVTTTRLHLAATVDDKAPSFQMAPRWLRFEDSNGTSIDIYLISQTEGLQQNHGRIWPLTPATRERLFIEMNRVDTVGAMPGI